MHEGIYWCDNCQSVFKTETARQVKSIACVHCGAESRYLTTDNPIIYLDNAATTFPKPEKKESPSCAVLVVLFLWRCIQMSILLLLINIWLGGRL